MKKTLGRAAKRLLVAAAVIYAVDWSVFELRQARGSAISTLPVEQYLKTSLKGGKEEYDYLGVAQVSCSRTLFPQYAASAWNPPCWWLARHTTSWR